MRLAWRENGRLRFAEKLSGTERQMLTLEWVEARRRFPTIRAAFDDWLPDWYPVFTRIED